MGVLNFLKNVLLVDVKNVGEDISIIEYINNYNDIDNTTLLFTNHKTITINKNNNEETFLLSNEKIKDINQIFNNITFNKPLTLKKAKFKKIGNGIFIDFYNNKGEKISFQLDFNELFVKNFNISENCDSSLEHIKLIKSNNKKYFLYLFFDKGYLKLDIEKMKIFL